MNIIIIRLQKFGINISEISPIESMCMQRDFHTFGISLDESVVINYPLRVERVTE